MLMRWHIVTSAEFKAGTPVATDLYFLTDTHEIYRGSVPYTEGLVLVTEFPAEGAVNRLYVNSTTLEGKVYDGSKWTTVVRPVVDEVTADGSDPVSSKAVIAYVAAELAKVAASKDTIQSLSWDSAEHILAVTKGDASTENIVFEGLGVSLQYTAADGKLQLVDAKGTAIGQAISIDLERFVTAGEYDDENKQIVLYFDAEKTDFVAIPVGDLVDTYTAEGDGKALTLTVENNTVKGSIKISTAEGNIITADENGLYVAATDISGKMDKDTDAVPGNIAVFDENGNAVDSNKTFDDIIPNNHVYEGASINEAVTGITPVKGDIVIVSTPIGETGKVQKTVHQYDGENWVAFDSDYDASKIILPADWITTSKIGVHQTLTGGQATIATAGTDVATALQKLTAKEEQPTVTQPAVSFTSGTTSEFKSYEVGTEVAVAVTAQLSAGTYSYGRINADGDYETSTSAGVAASAWTFTDTNGTEKTGSNTADFGTIEVTDGINYKVTAKADYNASAYKPATNFKNLSSKDPIAAGNKSATTGAITGYRNCFYGTVTTKTDPTSAIIRALAGKTGKAVAAGTAFDLSIPTGCMRAYVAYPASATSLTTLTSVKDANASDAQINSAFNMITLDVEGANGYDAVSYKVFYKDFAEAVDVANTYKVTL